MGSHVPFAALAMPALPGFWGFPGLPPETRSLLVFFALLLGLALVSVLLFFQHHTDASHGHSSGQSNLAATAQNQQKQPNKKMQWLLLAIGLAWGLLLGTRNIFFSIYVRDVVQSENIGLMLSVATLSEIPMLFFAFGGALLRLLLEALFPYFTAILLLQLLHSLAFATSIAVINKYFAAKKAWANLPAPVEHRLARYPGGLAD